MINKFKTLDNIGLISYLRKLVFAIRLFFATKSEMDVVATALTDLDRRINESIPTIEVGDVTTGTPGTPVQITNSGTETDIVLNFSIPRGEDGKNGKDGTNGKDGISPTITVGTVTTVASTESASVINSGTSHAAVLDFNIPQGPLGINGINGKDGTNGKDGVNGKDGMSATVRVGSVVTVTSNESATVTNSGTELAAILDFRIPKGADGANGKNADEDVVAMALTDLDNRKIELSDIPTSLPANGGNADYATTASKLGTASIGSGTLHFYLNTGTATASTSTVGGTSTPMYLKAGVMTAISDTIGSTSLPVYLDSGTITACTASSIFSNLSNSGNDLSITVAGQNRTLTVGYASKAGNADYAKYLRGRQTNGTYYGSEAGNNIIAEWNTKSDNRWYLKAASTYECRVDYATSAGNASTLGGRPVSDFILKSEHAGDMYETDDAGYTDSSGNNVPDYCIANIVWETILNPTYPNSTFATKIQVPVPSVDTITKLADCIKQVNGVTLIITLDNIGEQEYEWKDLHWLLRCENPDCIVYTTKYATPHGAFPSIVNGGNASTPPNTIDISVSYKKEDESRYVQITIENMYGRAYYTSLSFRKDQKNQS